MPLIHENCICWVLLMYHTMQPITRWIKLATKNFSVTSLSYMSDTYVTSNSRIAAVPCTTVNLEFC